VQGSAQEKLYFAGRLVLQGDASYDAVKGHVIDWKTLARR
jgi:hypothetical protein